MKASDTVNVQKFATSLFLFTNKLVISAGSHKMLFWIANREDPDQTASSEAVWSGSALFVFAFVVGNWCLKF